MKEKKIREEEDLRKKGYCTYSKENKGNKKSR